jgi:hypothetical protein
LTNLTNSIATQALNGHKQQFCTDLSTAFVDKERMLNAVSQFSPEAEN